MNSSLFFSPGLDPDAWRMLLVARYIADHHTYLASRLPGYPVPELVFSLLPALPDWVCSCLTALVAVGGFLAFHRLLQGIGVRNRLVLTLSFALTPVVIVNCFTTMDYLWAISFALLAFLLSVEKKYILSGLFLGIAVGCRLTTALMMVPLAYLVWSQYEDRRSKITACLQLIVSSAIVGLLCFGPVILTYGISFLAAPARSEISLASLLKTVTVDLFGIPALLGILLAAFVQLFSKPTVVADKLRDQRTWVIVCWLVLALYGSLFLWLPLDAGYLIPLLPFLYLVAQFHLKPLAFRILMMGLLASPFLLGFGAIDRPWSAPASPVSWQTTVAGRSLTVDLLEGPFVMDLLKRHSQLTYAQAVIRWAESQTDTAVVVTGPWQPALAFLSGDRIPSDKTTVHHVMLAGLIDKTLADSLRAERVPVYFLPGQNLYNKDVYGVRLEDKGGRELDLSGKTR